MEFNKRNDMDTFARSLLGMLYEGAPLKKISAEKCYEYLKMSSYISAVNAYMYTHLDIKKAMAEGWTLEEFWGHIQLELRNSWALLSKNKLGVGSFASMDIDEIIKSDDPYTLMRNSAYTKIKPKL